MIALSDGIFLYHGSYTEISEIDLKRCSHGLDFGRGFYLTSSFEQARNYVPAAVKKNIRRHLLSEDFDVNDGCVSIYRYCPDPQIQIHLFDAADTEWLHFVASNRNERLFPEERNVMNHIDIIGGKIANDRTATLLNAYISGDFGVPGSKRADNFTIEGLLPDRLKDQFCFRTEKSLQTLEFIGSERYGNRH